MTDGHQYIPAGFERHFRQSAVTDPWEPLYSMLRGDVFCLGLGISDAHCNARGILHGGVISTLADNALGICCVIQRHHASAVTVNLSLDFLAAGQKGQWLEVRAKPSKLGKTLAFSDAQIFADDAIIARANATFRITEKH
jgi:uncharacterized protein (TIGR00369 family)